MMKSPVEKILTACCMALGVMSMWSCARPGTPDGGPYDETPPSVVSASPKEGSTNAHNRTINIFFDEFVKLNNASEKVVISPPQINQPEISADGRKIKVKLLDSLKPNTTYTIDFSDAIVDNNEGNPMGKYTYTFSTGDSISMMEVSGKVLNARNLEPVKGILVGLHSDTTHQAFTSRPFDRMARTNGSGEFTIKGVAPGIYRAYALQDADGDYVFNQKSEMLAFSHRDIRPSSFPDQRADTAWIDSTHIDSITMVPYTHYVPDDIVLLAFSESTLDRHLLKVERKVPEHFDIYFTAPSEQQPTIRGLNFDEKALKPIYSPKNDTITYWISDTALVHTDTLVAAFTYLENDSAGNFVSRTDTLDLVSRLPRARQKKMEEEAFNDWQKKQEKQKKRGRPYETIMPSQKLSLSINGSGTLDLYDNIRLSATEPLAYIDTNAFHLYIREDTLYLPSDHLVEIDEDNPLRCTLYGEWRPQQEYLLRVDSAAMHSIYGKASTGVEIKFRIPPLDNYSTLSIDLLGRQDTLMMVELLNNSDQPVRTERARGGKATFFFLKPGTYYLRAYEDLNGNSQWDEGNYQDDRQAESVYYFPSPLTLRAKWDQQQDWDIHALPLIKQKPYAITKQKPDRERKIQNRNALRAKQWKPSQQSKAPQQK